MRARNVFFLIALGVLLLVLAGVYHTRYGGHSEFMKNFWGSAFQDRGYGYRTGGARPGEAGNLPGRYVDRPRAEVTAFVSSPGYRDAPPELRRMKLLEFFTLKVADVDFMLLSDADKKMVLDQFMRTYMIE